MDPITSLDVRDPCPIVSYSISNNEEMTEAVVNAFYAANIDVEEKPTTLADWLHADVLRRIQWTTDRSVRLSTRIWDHWTVMTPEEVRIYHQKDCE
jgi:hypothetical protein